jgi:hypothetical protein
LNTKTLFICASCKQKLRAGLTITELTGDEKPEKDECAFCHRKCYGGWYEVSYKGASA